jgi:hypothetical protein
VTKLLKTLEAYEHHAPIAALQDVSTRLHKVTSVRKVLINPDYIVTIRPFAGEMKPYTEEAQDFLRNHFSTKGLPEDYVEVVLDGNSFRASSLIIPRPLEGILSDLGQALAG